MCRKRLNLVLDPNFALMPAQLHHLSSLSRLTFSSGPLPVADKTPEVALAYRNKIQGLQQGCNSCRALVASILSLSVCRKQLRQVKLSRHGGEQAAPNLQDPFSRSGGLYWLVCLISFSLCVLGPVKTPKLFRFLGRCCKIVTCFNHIVSVGATVVLLCCTFLIVTGK